MSGEGSVLGASTSILLPAAAGLITGVDLLFYISAFFVLLVGLNIFAKGIKKVIEG